MTPDFHQHPSVLWMALTAAHCETIASIVEQDARKRGHVPIEPVDK